MRRVPLDSSRRHIWIILVVVAFLTVDAVLLAAALRPPDLSARPPHTIPTFTPTPTDGPSPTAGIITAAVPSNRVLSALDDGTAWRAGTGTCPDTAASPERSTDGGATWVPTDATGTAEVLAPQTLWVLDRMTVELVALDEVDCTPQFVKTFVDGADYARYPAQLATSWYVDPADRSAVHTPAGKMAAPCAAVVSLAAASASAGSAALLCADQTVFLTTDSGKGWSQSVRVIGAVNLGVTQMGYVIAAVGLPECAGVQLIALSVNPTTVTPTGCLPVDEPAETMQGNVAVAEAAGTLWVWAGDSVMRSIDQGTSWQ